VDGNVIPASKGRSSVLGKTDVGVSAPRRDGSGDIRIIISIAPEASVKLFNYTCSIDGTVVQPVPASTPATTAPSPQYITIKVNHAFRIDRLAGDRVVHYGITGVLVNRETNEPETTGEEVWVRFSDQQDIANIVKSSYKNSHIASSFPSFPTRGWDPRVDHFSDQFLHERTANLESFWRNLSGLPKIEDSADLRKFLKLPINATSSV
jgi:hypothetical protein